MLNTNTKQPGDLKLLRSARIVRSNDIATVLIEKPAFSRLPQCLAAAVLWAVAGTASAQSVNLVTNGSFEDRTSPPPPTSGFSTGIPDGWASTSTSTYLVHESHGTVPGNAAIDGVTIVGGGPSIVLSQTINVSGNAPLVIRWWANNEVAETTGPDIFYQTAVQLSDASGTFVDWTGLRDNRDPDQLSWFEHEYTTAVDFEPGAYEVEFFIGGLSSADNLIIFQLVNNFIYEALPMALQGLQDMPSLQQRVGNRHWAGEPAAAALASDIVFCKDPAQNFSCAVTPEQAQVFSGAPSEPTIEGGGAWVRVDGSSAAFTPEVSRADVNVDESIGSIEAGIDRLLYENEEGDRVIGGVSLRYAQSGVDVSDAFGEGSIDTDGFGIGAALTWYDTEGLYVDAQARALWTRSDLASTDNGTLAEDLDGFGYGLSVEIGREIALSETWIVTPQAQLSYSRIEADDFTGPLATVTNVENESLALRAGVVASNEVDWVTDDGTTSRRTLNVGLHVTKELRPESSVAVSGTTGTSETDDVTGEITLGGTYNWSDDKYSVYGQVSAATGLNSFGDNTRFGATAGARIQWE